MASNIELFNLYCNMRREVKEFTEKKLDEFAAVFLSHHPCQEADMEKENSEKMFIPPSKEKLKIPKGRSRPDSLKKRLEEKEKHASSSTVTSIKNAPSSSVSKKRKSDESSPIKISIPVSHCVSSSFSKKLCIDQTQKEGVQSKPLPSSSSSKGKDYINLKKSSPTLDSKQERKNPFRDLEEKMSELEKNDEEEQEEEEEEEEKEEEEKEEEEKEEEEKEEEEEENKEGEESESEMGSDLEEIN